MPLAATDCVASNVRRGHIRHGADDGDSASEQSRYRANLKTQIAPRPVRELARVPLS